MFAIDERGQANTAQWKLEASTTKKRGLREDANAESAVPMFPASAVGRPNRECERQRIAGLMILNKLRQLFRAHRLTAEAS